MVSKSIVHTGKLADANILLFGGTSGIGFATASLCIASGARATVSGSNAAQLEDAVRSLRSSHPAVSADVINGVRCDLSDTEALEKNLSGLLDEATEQGSRKLDHITFTAVNDVHTLPLEKITVADLSKPNFQLAPTIIIAKLIQSGKYMEKTQNASFTITGGSLADRPVPNVTMTYWTGSGLRGLNISLALELKPVRVNLVEPGIIKTELLDRFLETRKDALDEFVAQSLFGGIGKPEDTAEAFVCIMKDHFITGSILKTNGGRLLM